MDKCVGYRESKREFGNQVGLLWVSGIALFCGIILFFSELPDFFNPTYQIVVRLPDASGVTKGSDVSLAGALIGKVIADPQIVPGTQGVEITLKIDRSDKLRRDARFVIESSGFFGDVFVNVQPMDHGAAKDAVPYLQNGDIVQGAQEPGFSSIIAASLPLIARANHVAGQLDDMVTRLNTKVLTKASTDDLKETAAKVQKISTDSTQLADNSREIIDEVKSGHGVLGQLLYDKQVRRNLTDFIANYKAHGLLFYSDDFAPPPSTVNTRPSWRARP